MQVGQCGPIHHKTLQPVAAVFRFWVALAWRNLRWLPPDVIGQSGIPEPSNNVDELQPRPIKHAKRAFSGTEFRVGSVGLMLLPPRSFPWT